MLQASPPAPARGWGKVILLGEHAVVYGSHALAAPLPLSIVARASPRAEPGLEVSIAAWDIACTVDPSRLDHVFHASMAALVAALGLDLSRRGVALTVTAEVPRAYGLGASAALAVAAARALSTYFGLGLDDARIDAAAFASERVVHGHPSGVDNALATYGRFLLYKKGTPPRMDPVRPGRPLPLVVGLSGAPGLTAAMVAHVRRGWEATPPQHEAIFAEVDRLSRAGCAAVEAGDLPVLGALMRRNHALLGELGVSTPALDRLVTLAEQSGALGAKLTGGGGGGAMVALCPGRQDDVVAAFEGAGFAAHAVRVGAEHGPLSFTVGRVP